MESSDRAQEDIEKKGRNSRYHMTHKRGRPSIAESSNVPKLFKCGCGKDYSTNGALFSHTRIKHGGVQPPGSTRMRNTNRKPRKDCGISRKIKTEKGGRKREGGIMMSSWEVDLLALLNSTVGGRDQSLERSVSQMITLFKMQEPPLPDIPESQILKRHFVQLQEELGAYVTGAITQGPQATETSSDKFERDLWDIISHFKKAGWKLHIYLSTCLFVYSVSRFASLSFLVEILALLSVFLNFINTEGGQEVEKQILKKDSESKYDDYCMTHDSEYVPELASAFMKYRYVSKITQHGDFEGNSSACNLFGKTASHLLRVMHLFSLMISWLNSHELSNCEWQIEGLPKLDHPFLLEPQQPKHNEGQTNNISAADEEGEEESVYIEDSESSDQDHRISNPPVNRTRPTTKSEPRSKIEPEEPITPVSSSDQENDPAPDISPPKLEVLEFPAAPTQPSPKQEPNLHNEHPVLPKHPATHEHPQPSPSHTLGLQHLPHQTINQHHKHNKTNEHNEHYNHNTHNNTDYDNNNNHELHEQRNEEHNEELTQYLALHDDTHLEGLRPKTLAADLEQSFEMPFD